MKPTAKDQTWDDITELEFRLTEYEEESTLDDIYSAQL